MRIDSHCHIFTPKILKNVSGRTAMMKELNLDGKGAFDRVDPDSLAKSALENNLDYCILLPTASPESVVATNRRFIEISRAFPRLKTLGTLHPMMENLSDEISRTCNSGVRGFKFSSFSQRFDVLWPEVDAMLDKIERGASERGFVPAVVWDTFTKADLYFGAKADHITTPQKLDAVVNQHPGINFIAAHMGGLLADFDELRSGLKPAPNLFLDTSNAAHTLTEDRFVELLHLHGPANILFGTDWPWFDHTAELQRIHTLMDKADFSGSDQDKVFGATAGRLFSLDG
jgi:uncharacterized protein